MWRYLALFILPSLLQAASAEIRVAVKPDGTLTQSWRQITKGRRGRVRPHPLTQKEQDWLALFKRELPKWEKKIPKLNQMFPQVPSPQSVIVQIANTGGPDGFTFGAHTIGINLSEWVKVYGTADRDASRGRVQRILSHEYVHLLVRSRDKLHPFPKDTAWNRALYILYNEGLGTFQSLSPRWFAPGCGLSQFAKKILKRNSAKLIRRLRRLKTPLTKMEESLALEGISWGSFTDQWGALTVALWLAKEAKGNPSNFKWFIDSGPSAVLKLANKNLTPADQLTSPKKNSS